MMLTYSNVGQTIVRQADNLTGGSAEFSFLRRNQSFFFFQATEQILVIWEAQLRSLLVVTPKYFTGLSVFISLDFSVLGKLGTCLVLLVMRQATIPILHRCKIFAGLFVVVALITFPVY